MINRSLIHKLFEARKAHFINEIKINRGTVQIIFSSKVDLDRIIKLSEKLVAEYPDLKIQGARLQDIGETPDYGHNNDLVLCIADKGFDPLSKTCVYARSAQDAINFYHRVGSRNKEDYKQYLKYRDEIEEFFKQNMDYEDYLQYQNKPRSERDMILISTLKIAFESLPNKQIFKLRNLMLDLEEQE